MAHYFELSFPLGELDAEAAEAACRACGALAVTFSDAADQPVLEPLPGEMRLWPNTRVQALYSAAQASGALIVQLAQQLALEPAALAARAVADRVWEREWLRDFHAMRFGERVWICPRHEHVSAPGALVVRLDPGLAFGTGTHPSTALCLEWLDEAAGACKAGAAFQHYIIDYGCGSGILAVTALLLGARGVYAFDIDSQALIATRQNAEENAVADRLHLCERGEQLPRGCQLLMANILGSVLKSLAPQFAALLGTGARLLMAGILAEEQAEMAAAFAKWFDMQQFRQREGWVALTGIRY